MKICIASSSGGHLSETLLVRNAWRGHEYFYVTTPPVLIPGEERDVRTYVLPSATSQTPLKLMPQVVKCLRILHREKPDIVISSGSAMGCIMCLLAKMYNRKIIWLESMASVNRLSYSGYIIHFIADQFLVQWPGLAGRYKNVRYVGLVL